MRITAALVFATAATSALASFKTHHQTPLIPSTSNTEAEVVRKALIKSSIIPEVLDDFTPKCFIAASYSKGAKTYQGIVDLGNDFKPEETKQRPHLSISCPEGLETKGLVVALTDPDAKSRDDPKWSEMCHWIYVVPTGFQTAAGAAMDITIPTSVFEGRDLVDYKPPGPPPKTGYHRYVFVVLVGDTTNITAPEERRHWGTGKVRRGVRDWAGKQGLQVIGANWFVEEDEEQ
ncbi:related to putative lipid binding protein TFS1 [Rhynchosporium secalis]|uniref:Related to putative lipid binding protein TFS1 n=1 Tax=Rhynchosporium secalis TaxID=38038 RepID=A0A1E1M0X8_RHYSE|nr:related to putative lipid binding protein TFS1 [Rhynchosporium secalis]